MLKLTRVFSKEGIHPYDEINWIKKDVLLKNKKTGEVLSDLRNLEFPDFWSDQACQICATKYFLVDSEKTQKETSLKQLIDRIVGTMTYWGIKQDYFDKETSCIFKAELTYLMAHQYAIFNTPVMINLGTRISNRSSACFITGIEDSLDSIYDTIKLEADIFKNGSGSGINISTLRAKGELLSNGGTSCGIMEFLKVFDTSAGAIKSAGRGRRSARMVCLDADHPEIEDFITCKMKEEKKAQALIDAGFDGSFDGEVTRSIQFQNANHSIRLTDDFMRKVLSNEDYDLLNRVNKDSVRKIKARDLLMKAAEATYYCGDPGIQYHDTTNNWFTCSDTKILNGSNPCGEFTHMSYTSCNLATLNILKFLKPDNTFNFDLYKQAIDVVLTAQDIIIDYSDYPNEEFRKNSSDYRPLGLGYTNLGALLMVLGLPYDSDQGRLIASGLAAYMTSEAYAQSSRFAICKGKPFKHYEANKQSMKNVLTKHLVEINIKSAEDDKGIGGEAFNKAYEVLYEVKDLPMYNSAVTLFAPNGTTGLCLGCDTTSIEPCLALVSFKELVGGGYMKIVNNSVKRALENLGYIKEDVEKILNYISKNNTIEGSILRDEHLSIFDCALESYKGSRVIHYNGHIDMMAALQPFISMAISKTINAPEDITINEIFDIYVDSWKKGLKSITIYRDGSKKTQPLKTAKKEKAKEVKKEAIKKSLPDERSSITHKFNIAGHEGYLTVGLYEDGTPGELFVKMSKEGSVISGLMDSLAKSISLAIQHGVPLESLIDKFVGTKFDPSGVTINKDIPIAKSIVDYIFTWLDQKFVNKKACVPCSKKVELVPITDKKEDAGACQVCGGLLQWSGHCKVCASCGTSTGCS